MNLSVLPKVLSVDSALSALCDIANILLSGGVIALPTDTIYGLACCSLSTNGIKRVYEIKGRDAAKPIAVCLDKPSSLPHWSNTQGIDHSLFSRLLPGPVTILLPRLSDDPLNPLLNPGVDEIGIRVPDSPLACKLSAELANILRDKAAFGNSLDIHARTHCFSVSGIPLVLTSANHSGKTSTLSPEEFFELWPQLDLVIDGGRIGGDSNASRAGSTVVDLSPAVRSHCQRLHYRILRVGSALEATEHTLREFGFSRKPDVEDSPL